jgi:hypothetical protein
MHFTYFPEPIPHIYIDQLVDPEVYARARFPELAKKPDGRIGRDLYRGEDGYDDVIATPGWGDIRSYLTGPEFVSEVIKSFSGAMRSHGCLADPDRCHLQDYIEPRSEVQQRRLDHGLPPEVLFTRFDFQAADRNYRKYIHVDWPRRLIGGALFFCSAEEEGLEGGAFGLYEDRKFRNDRICHSPVLTRDFPIRHNTGVLFLNSNTGFHGPAPIRRIEGMRKWIYYSISSHVDIWPYQRPSFPLFSRLRAKISGLLPA